MTPLASRVRGFSLLVLFAIGCSSPSAGSADPAPRSEAISGGTASGEGDDHVVLLLTHVPARDTPAGQFYANCTGTLLAPNLVITARHCVASSEDEPFLCDVNGDVVSGGGEVIADYVPENTYVFVGPRLPSGGLDPTTFPGRGREYVHNGNSVSCNDDVALIVLDEAIEGAKVSPVRLEGDVDVGDPLVVVGWGSTDTDAIPSRRQRRDDVVVTHVGPSEEWRNGGQLGPNEVEATEAVCSGDSGGPTFDAETGALVGVNVRATSIGDSQGTGYDCTHTSYVFHQTTAFADLIREGFERAGAEPWIEGTNGPGEPVSADAGVPSEDAGPATRTPDDGGGCAASHGPPSATTLMLFALTLLARRKRTGQRA